MKHRNPIAVALLPLVTFGIYALYWQIQTKVEMNSIGAKIPTAWLILVPLVNIWWLWKYGEGVEQITGGKLSGILAFLLLWLLGPIGAAIVQDSFNNNVAVTATAGSPVAPAPPVAGTDPGPVPPVNPEPPVATPPATPVS